MRPGEIKGEIDRVIRGLKELGLSGEDAEAMMHGKGGERLPADKTLALIAFDADAVQAQIFASPRPVTIQGASLRLRAWDRDLGTGKILAHRAVVLFAGGGQAMLLTRAGEAEGVRQTLSEAFHSRTSGSPCTTASLALSPRELAAGAPRAQRLELTVEQQKRLGWSPQAGVGFGACMARLALALRQEKGTPQDHPFLKEASSAARCEECGERPRLNEGRCQRCQQNREAGAKEKRKWAQALSFDDVLGEPRAPEPDDEDGEEASGSDRRRARHLAFLRLDGKGIGAVLERLRTMAQYSAISLGLRRAFELEHPEDDLAGLGVPAGRYQLPIAGGDDLLLIVPGRWAQPSGNHGDALSLCSALLGRIERAFEEPEIEGVFAEKAHREVLADVRKIGAGAGVVITSGLPAKFCFDYAGELLRSAKEVISGDPGARSAVDFAVIRGGSAVSSSVTELRNTGENVAELDLGGTLTGKVRKTRCPYPLAAFNAMLERARLLAEVPRSGIYGLRAAMAEPTTGMIAMRYQLARDRDLRRALIGDASLSTLSPALSEWILAPLDNSHDPNAPRWASAISDLLDALRFVGSTEDARKEDAQ